MQHKIGILGAGHIAHKMAYTVGQMAGYKVEAVASRQKERAEEFARQYGIAKAYGSYDQLLADPQVELVYIATPHSLHYAQARQCLLCGKPVLCEKTFTTTAAQAEELFALSRQQHVFIAEAVWTRFMPLSGVIQQLIRNRAVGEPHMLTANLCYPVSGKERLQLPQLGGGALLDIGTYALHFAAMAFGTHVHSTTSSCQLFHTGVDAQLSIIQHYQGQRMAVLHSSILCRSDRKGIISGTDGYMVVENINNPQSVRVYDQRDNLLAEHLAPQQITGFEYQVEACFQALTDGQIETPYIPHVETLRIMRIMDSLRAEWGVKFEADETFSDI